MTKIILKIGYARVSTYKQLKKGHSLKDQAKELKRAGCNIIYKEQFTGTKKSRPEFNKVKILLSNDNKKKELILTRLDRLARNMTDMLDIVRDFTKHGVVIKILNPPMTIDDKSSMGKAILGIMATFSELERNMIYERMQGAKDYLLSQGDKSVKGGRPSRLSTKTSKSRKKLKNYKGIYHYFIERKHLQKKDPKYYIKYIKEPPARATADTFGISRQTVYNVYNTFKSQNNEKK